MRSIIVYLALGLEAVVFCASAQEEHVGPVAPADWVFECKYVSRAWGFVVKGFYINEAGELYRFASEDDAENPYERATRVGEIERDKLDEWMGLIEPAADGTLRSEHIAFDAGTSLCRAHRQGAGPEGGSVVELGSIAFGSYKRTSTSEEARRLVRWLKGVDEQFVGIFTSKDKGLLFSE